MSGFLAGDKTEARVQDREPSMGKGKVKWPAKIGVILLVAAGLIILIVFLPLGSTRKLTIAALALNLGQASIVCFWWPLIRRPQFPLRLRFAIPIAILGILYLLVILIMAVFAATSVQLWVAPVLVAHFAIAAWLLKKPRLLLTWSAGVLLTLVLLWTVALKAGGFLELAVFLSFLAIVLGSAVGFPLAWWWTRPAGSLQPLR